MDRQANNGLTHPTDGNDRCFSFHEPCDGMGRAPSVGYRCSRYQTTPAQRVDQARNEHGFATLEMIRTFCVHHDAIVSIDSDDRGVLPQCPKGETFDGRGVRSRISVDHRKVGDNCLSLACSHADAQTNLPGGRVNR